MSEIQSGPLPQAAVDGEHHPGPLRRANHIGRVTDAWREWWKRKREGREVAKPIVAEHQAGPLPQADPDDEHRAGPLVQTVHPQRVRRKGWREKRWERRRRRRFTEEVLGWVLVPVILLAGFWAVKAGLNALGTNFTSLIQGIKTAVSAAGRG